MESYLKDFKPRGLRISMDEKKHLISLGYSYCAKCESVKELKEFSSDKSNRYGFEPSCKECKKMIARDRRFDDPNPSRIASLAYRNKNIEKARASKRLWSKDNVDYENAYRRDKYRKSPEYKMQILCRQLTRRMFKSTGIKKCYKTSEILGYTSEQLKSHIESKFKPGMTWDNYGEWHVDHLRPISLAKSVYDGIILSQLDNLQPLWAMDNLIKGNKIIEPMETV